MGFNYGVAYRIFLKELAEKHKLYAQIGLRQDQVDALDEYDWAEFHSNCVFYFHNIPFDFRDDIDTEAEEEFLAFLTGEDPTARINYPRNDTPFAWMDEITSPKLLKKLVRLPICDLMLLDESVFRNITQKEIAEKLGISQKNVSKKLTRIKNFLGNDE